MANESIDQYLEALTQPINLVTVPRTILPEDWNNALLDDYEGTKQNFQTIKRIVQTVAREGAFIDGTGEPIEESNLSRLYLNFDSEGELVGIYATQDINSSNWRRLADGGSTRVTRSAPIENPILTADNNNGTVIYSGGDDEDEHFLALPTEGIADDYNLTIINEISENVTLVPINGTIDGQESIELETRQFVRVVFEEGDYYTAQFPVQDIPEVKAQEAPLSGSGVPNVVANNSRMYINTDDNAIWWNPTANSQDGWEMVSPQAQPPVIPEVEYPQVQNFDPDTFITSNRSLISINSRTRELWIATANRSRSWFRVNTQDPVQFGKGSPENTVTVNASRLYVDTEAMALYYNESGADNTGWVMVAGGSGGSVTLDQIQQGIGDPNGGVVVGSRGLYYDAIGQALYISRSPGSTSWRPVRDPAATALTIRRVVTATTSFGLSDSGLSVFYSAGTAIQEDREVIIPDNVILSTGYNGRIRNSTQRYVNLVNQDKNVGFSDIARDASDRQTVPIRPLQSVRFVYDGFDLQLINEDVGNLSFLLYRNLVDHTQTVSSGSSTNRLFNPRTASFSFDSSLFTIGSFPNLGFMYNGSSVEHRFNFDLNCSYYFKNSTTGRGIIQIHIDRGTQTQVLNESLPLEGAQASTEGGAKFVRLRGAIELKNGDVVMFRIRGALTTATIPAADVTIENLEFGIEEVA